MNHERAAELLTEFLQGRVAGVAAEEIAAHLQGCAECAAAAETFRLLKEGAAETVGALDGGGANDPQSQHPTTEEIATFSIVPKRLGESSMLRVRAHIETCGRCAEEVEITRGAAALTSSAVPASVKSAARGSRSPWRGIHTLALAASIGALLLAYPAFRGLVDLPVETENAARLNEETAHLRGEADDLRRSLNRLREEADRSRAWSGAVPLPVLTSRYRGAQSEATVIRVQPGQPFVPIAVLPVLPSGAAAGDSFTFEIRREGGDPVWKLDLTAGRIRDELRASKVVTFLISTATLSAGHYELRLQAGGPTEREPIFVAPFRVTIE